MSARSTDHPELGAEGNPLLEGLAPYVTLLPMAKLLQNEPLKQIRWQSLKPELRAVLDPFVSSLQGDTAVRLSIIGHTDSTGSDSINNPLSLERAHSVRDYLTARGVSSTRIETSGRGEREPIADNASDAGRAKNRRVEIFLRETGQQG